MSKQPESILERREKERSQQLIQNRRERFEELLGKDCDFIDALIINTDISPWDVKKLIDNGCSEELIFKILL
jgi:hypothetical protein